MKLVSALNNEGYGTFHNFLFILKLELIFFKESKSLSIFFCFRSPFHVQSHTRTHTSMNSFNGIPIHLHMCRINSFYLIFSSPADYPAWCVSIKGLRGVHCAYTHTLRHENLTHNFHSIIISERLILMCLMYFFNTTKREKKKSKARHIS